MRDRTNFKQFDVRRLKKKPEILSKIKRRNISFRITTIAVITRRKFKAKVTN